MTIHVALVAEPNDAYINMTRLFAFSLRARGGALAGAPLHVLFNDRIPTGEAELLRARWGASVTAQPRIPSALGFTNKWNCLTLPDLSPDDWILFCDCDTAVISPLDQLVELARSGRYDFMACPTNVKQAWKLDRILMKHTGRSAPEIEATAHEWFPSRYPIFNSGVFALRAAHAAALRRAVVPLCEVMHRSMRATSVNPLRQIAVRWNRKVWKRPDADRLVLGAWFPKNHAGQLALAAGVVKLGLRFRVLDHAWNWRVPGLNQGEEWPIRILHYLSSRFTIDRKRLFEGGWIDEFSKSENPGKRELATLAAEYVRMFPAR